VILSIIRNAYMTTKHQISAFPPRVVKIFL